MPYCHCKKLKTDSPFNFAVSLKKSLLKYV